MWTVGLAVVWAIGPPVLWGLGQGNDVVEFVVAQINPLMSDQLWKHSTRLPIQLIVSVGIWATFALAVFVDNVRGLSRRAIRQ
jgi:hypothetical protein